MLRQVKAITIDYDVMERVNAIRGATPFSRWIEEAVVKRLEEEEEKDAETTN